MTPWKRVTLAALLLAWPVLATGAPRDGASTMNEMQNQANFCEGTYALCIKAPCAGIPTLDRLGNYVIERALCSCEVVQGVSMGPGSCADRAPVTQQGRTYLISTYSNRFNDTSRTLTCQNSQTVWAWCYGAPCVLDENNPGKATCTCPLMQSAMSTLGGDCRQEACNGIWSAATPAGDAFASTHFFRTVQKDYPRVPVNQPAQMCPAR
jgi:hypothetical protein